MNPNDLSSLPGLVCAWYRENRRRLPWREEVSPYRTLVSEIMLQQTRVEAVKPYFERFLEAFPDVESLAEADDDLLMKRWEGLGYYSRARNLKAAAQAVVERFGGEIPSAVSDLLTLPGIGPYTAGAVSAFAFNRPAAAVDGNVLRVMARVVLEGGDILSPAVRGRLSDLVLSLVPTDSPSDFGQGLIELGALVCRPNLPPKCAECPLAGLCRAKREEKTDVIPYRAPKKERRIEDKTVLVIRSGMKTLLHRRPPKGLLAGLWEFPNLPGAVSENDALAECRRLGFEPLRIKPLDPAKHIFTHIEWHLTGYLITVGEDFGELPDGYAMPDTDSLFGEYAIPSAFSAFK